MKLRLVIEDLQLLAGDRRRSGLKSDSLFITDTFSIAGGRTGSAESVVFVLIS